ncbi:MAG TPA: oxygen-dependent coproporphyrinogen oxidase [Saprospiraceae bacterium]|nr:oxygen-dependent coproporphyrinogen oxidase [Saprospiraceae bacterium]
MIDKDEIIQYFQGLQDSICHQLEKADGGGIFREDHWERPGGGGGRSRVIQGKRIEKGGVNFSAVHGTLNEKAGKALGIAPGDFMATGVSIVLHPFNPHVPIIHMNVRYFEMSEEVWWFGGGIDLTPHFVVPAEAAWFHRQLKQVCDAHDSAYYSEFKKWADDYFYLRHRKETRGVGGIFFDRLSQNKQHDKAQRFAFVKQVGEAFAPIYAHFLNKKADLPFSTKEKAWQALRRGRYVEFNLVWDRGTKFGLETDGRTESILMSMPPMAQWAYDHQPEPNSEEARTLGLLKKDIDWLSLLA